MTDSFHSVSFVGLCLAHQRGQQIILETQSVGISEPRDRRSQSAGELLELIRELHKKSAPAQRGPTETLTMNSFTLTCLFIGVNVRIEVADHDAATAF